ncbi:unnamed protein product [Cladocopium goreaui]|uniref:Uncharacterized protein n=1 Tax=Cladocopium goreaui TaxID=2562237 RepID=A0A9P1CQG2_9DINO|nr:unnamed protein product [Cladocopium goreaui]
MTDHDQSSAVQDYFLDSLEYTSSFVEWNFGDADEEAQAFSSGSTAKINKVNKKTQRLHIIRLSELKEVQHQDKLRFPFLGHVSTTKSASSIPFCKLFGCVFYFVPPAAPSPTSSIVIPSWLIQTTNKAAQATITEQVVTVHCVMLPISGALTAAIQRSESEMPMIKYVAPKKKDEPPAHEPSSFPDQEQRMGYGFAVVTRKKDMETAGMQTSLPTMTKEQRKVEKEKRKALLNAKHLLR